MAITNANFNNGDYVKSGGKRLVTCTSDVWNTHFHYRFYLEVTYGGNTYAYTFRPNNSGYGVINLSKILQTIVKPISQQQVLTVPEAIEDTGTTDFFKQNLHTIPHEKYNAGGNTPQFFSTSGTTVKKVTLTIFDYYSTTSTGTPSKKTSGSATGDIYLFSGYDMEADKINVDYSNYHLTGSTKLMLNNNYLEENGDKQIDVALTDWGTVAFFNRTENINMSAQPERLRVMYYNINNNFLGEQILSNIQGNGGKYDAAGVSDDSMILYAGVYPANLNKLDATFNRPSDNPTLAYYTVKPVTTVNAPKSIDYRFNIISPCEKYERQRFAFINSFGVWEYISFNEKRTDKISSKNTTIKRSVYDYSATYNQTGDGYNERAYIPNVAHSNEQIVANEIEETFTINTGYLKESDVTKVRDLFVSPLVHYIKADGSAKAVILTTKNIQEITTNNYEQISYSLTFKYSVPRFNEMIF